MSRFQDAPGAPTPDTKRKRISLAALAALGVIGILVVAIKAGKSTKDPVKPTVTASDQVKSELSGEANRGVQTQMDSLVNADASVGSVGDEAEKEIEAKAQRKFEDADQQVINQDRKRIEDKRKAMRQREGMALDADGHPIDPDAPDAPGQEAHGSNPDGTKKMPLPGYAEGWEPRGEIFQAPEEGRPAMRYKPAFLTGQNLPSTNAGMKKLEDKWIDSVGAASIGNSDAANERLNKSLGAAKHLAVEQGRHPSARVLRVSNGYAAELSAERTAVECEVAPDGTLIREVGPMAAPKATTQTARRPRKKRGRK